MEVDSDLGVDADFRFNLFFLVKSVYFMYVLLFIG